MGLSNPLHVAVLVLIVVLLFGARRLPELGKSLGSGIREFKGSIGGDEQHSVSGPPADSSSTGPAQATPVPQAAAPGQPAGPNQADSAPPAAPAPSPHGDPVAPVPPGP